MRCQGHYTVSGDNPRSWGRRIAHLRTSVVPYLFFYPLESYQQHACARGIALLASCVGRAVRVFVGDATTRPGWKHALRTPRSGRLSAQQARATHWATAQPHGTCSFRLLETRVVRVGHAETARVRPEAKPHSCVSLRRRVADLLHKCTRTQVFAGKMGPDGRYGRGPCGSQPDTRSPHRRIQRHTDIHS